MIIIFAGFGQPDLFRLEAGSGLPIHGAFDDLAHVVEPPMGAMPTALALNNARTTICSCQTQFHLFLIGHK